MKRSRAPWTERGGGGEREGRREGEGRLKTCSLLRLKAEAGGTDQSLEVKRTSHWRQAATTRGLEVSFSQRKDQEELPSNHGFSPVM